MRQWIKRDHSIWRVLKEVDIESIVQSERSSSITYEDESKIEKIGIQKKWLIPAAIALIAVLIVVWWINRDAQPETTPEKNSNIEQKELASGSDNANNKSESANQEDINPVENKPAIEKTEKKIVSNNPAKRTNNRPDISKGTTSSPPTKMNNKADQILPSRSAMLESKSQAMLASAADLASSTFNNGLSAEADAERLSKQKKYEEAIKKYQEAEKQFIAAKAESKSAAADAKNRISKIIKKMQTIQKDLKPEHKSLNEYQNAERLRKKGEQYNSEGKYTLAYDNYSEAVSLYEETVQIRIKQTEKIQGTLRGYAQAMENKAILGSKYIQDSYEPELQEEWESFFELADEIKIDIDIRDIEFNKNTATVLVDILLNYSGAGGSGEKYKWKIALVEGNPDWQISNISKAN
jgi:tetratricopeptide (TPR) repeat protein